jgi:hypothetical protein
MIQSAARCQTAPPAGARAAAAAAIKAAWADVIGCTGELGSD